MSEGLSVTEYTTERRPHICVYQTLLQTQIKFDNKVLSYVYIYFTSFLALLQPVSTISFSRPLQNNDSLFVQNSQQCTQHGS